MSPIDLSKLTPKQLAELVRLSAAIHEAGHAAIVVAVGEGQLIESLTVPAMDSLPEDRSELVRWGSVNIRHDTRQWGDDGRSAEAADLAEAFVRVSGEVSQRVALGF